MLEFVDREDDHPHREQRFSEKLACPNGHPLAVDDLEPRSFSFNSPYGACRNAAAWASARRTTRNWWFPIRS